jgi:hypothetical protein
VEVRRSIGLGSTTWDEVVVRVDAIEIGRPNAAELRDGVEYKLFDHSMLRMWVEHGPGNSPPLLMITRNGHPLPKSQGDPVMIVRSTLIMILFFTLMQIAIGLMFVFTHSDDTEMDWSLALGSIMALLVAFTWWNRSAAAMAAVSLFFLGEWVLFLGTHFIPWYLPSMLGAIIGLGWMMLRGVKAARDLEAMTLPIRHPPEPIHPSDAA